VSSNGYVLDGSFIIILTNSISNNFTWITPGGNLGTVPAGDFYSLPLQTETPNNITVTYSFLSGELPGDMRVIPSGFVQGVPTFSSAVAVDQSQTYRFTVRATASTGQVVDQSFSLTLTDVFGPVIEPSTTNLGTFFDGTFYSQQLTVSEASLNPNIAITWTVKEGVLPNGVTLSSTGLLSGFLEPVQLVGQYGPAGYDGEAVIGELVQAGNLIIGGSYTIQTIGTTDFTKFGAALNSPGDVFTATGIGSGSGTAVYNNQNLSSNEDAEFDYAPYDFNQLNQTLGYTFTIQAYDGANYDTQKYFVEIIARSNFTADSGFDLVNDTYVTADSTNVGIPVILNGDITTLPTGRQDSYYAYQFVGTDFAGNINLTFSTPSYSGTFDAYVTSGTTPDAGFDYGGTGTNLSSTEDLNPIDLDRGGVGFDSYSSNGTGSANLPGIILDPKTGWLYGKLLPQSSPLINYVFGVQVSTVANNVTYSSRPIFFTLPVTGDVNNLITWNTASNLGSIDNGSVSDLSVSATSLAGLDLTYSILDASGVSAGLPQGLTLLPSGDISGRVSFEAFGLDENTTTFDSSTMTIDRTYTFTVIATTSDQSATASREFTIALNIIDFDPYINLYLEAYPPADQRALWDSLFTNTNIFDPDLIYKPTDPWFGVNQDLKMLFLTGLNSDTLDQFAQAITQNNWTKTYTFGDVKTAVVLDENYNVKYEVVYVEMIDPEEVTVTSGPPLEINLSGVIANPYIDASGNEFKTIYPNTSEDMINRLVTDIGYYDQSSLPPWMTSNQPGTSSSSTFSPPLGYTQAIVLAYTTAGNSAQLAYRLKNSNFNFNNISFVADRYIVDNYYSTNFSGNNWILGAQTTFDSTPSNNVGIIAATVNYGVSTPFDQINGRTVDYINANGGIDGVTNFVAGQTLIFVQQENFVPKIPYDGWVNYIDGFIGDNIDTGINGFGSEPFDEYTVVPGYLENIVNSSVSNNRGSVWQIVITVDNIVTLTPVQVVLPNQRIKILNGGTYNGAIVYYNSVLTAGQTVPTYTIFHLNQNAVTYPTTFNSGSTRFISNRDQYYIPGTQDKYLKFPQTGAFN
jgi:hypothetical protein